MVNAAPGLANREIKLLELVSWKTSGGIAGIKTTSLIAAGILKNEAIAAGADDALLVKDGKITEATSANLFVVINGVLVTPPKTTKLLHGITRDFVLELAEAADIPNEQRDYTGGVAHSGRDVHNSSTMEAYPVGSLDGKKVGNGAPNIWQKTDLLFQEKKLNSAIR